jgi:hypothetical protein
VEIEWKSNADLSALHTAWCLNHWPADCRKGSEELRAAANALAAAAERMNVTAARFWELLLVLVVDTPTNRDLIDRTMVRLVPAAARIEARLSELTSCLATYKSLYAREFPDFERNIRLRTEPLRQQWEAYGPGLLVLIGQSTDEAAMAERAEVLLVEPCLGGGGFSHLSTNRCHIEAVLTNVDPQLTETLRLAWLLTQLEFERPAYSDWINAFRLRKIAGLATLPPTLRAGQELGICDFSPTTVQNAIELWRIAGPGEQPAVLREIVMTWWETVEASQPEWRIALTALDRMLE